MSMYVQRNDWFRLCVCVTFVIQDRLCCELASLTKNIVVKHTEQIFFLLATYVNYCQETAPASGHDINHNTKDTNSIVENHIHHMSII